MAKKLFSIVDVFMWFSNVLDTQDLTSSEQLVLLHIIKILNRNFWQPIQVSEYKLAVAMGRKDRRTVHGALEKLTERNLIIRKGELIHLGIFKFINNESEQPNFKQGNSGDVGGTLADYLNE